MARKSGYQTLPKVTNKGVAPYIPSAIKAGIRRGKVQRVKIVIMSGTFTARFTDCEHARTAADAFCGTRSAGGL